METQLARYRKERGTEQFFILALVICHLRPKMQADSYATFTDVHVPISLPWTFEQVLEQLEER